MKKIIYGILLLVGNLSQIIAQGPPVPIYTPIITDAVVAGLTGTATANYGLINTEETLVLKVVNDYKATYNKRATYLGTGVSIVNIFINDQINSKVDDTKKRYDKLKVENEKLNKVKFYSKKKKNLKLIRELDLQITILEEELKDKSKSGIIGEKINLYQNAMRTLAPINRKLDTLESNINKSNSFKKIIKMITKK